MQGESHPPVNCQYPDDKSCRWKWREGNRTEAKRQEYRMEMEGGGENVTFEDSTLSFRVSCVGTFWRSYENIIHNIWVLNK